MKLRTTCWSGPILWQPSLKMMMKTHLTQTVWAFEVVAQQKNALEVSKTVTTSSQTKNLNETLKPYQHKVTRPTATWEIRRILVSVRTLGLVTWSRRRKLRGGVKETSNSAKWALKSCSKDRLQFTRRHRIYQDREKWCSDLLRWAASDHNPRKSRTPNLIRRLSTTSNQFSLMISRCQGTHVRWETCLCK